MSVLAEALASMSPEARAVLADELETIVRLLRTPPVVRRPRAKHVPARPSLEGISPEVRARVKADLARHGVG